MEYYQHGTLLDLVRYYRDWNWREDERWGPSLLKRAEKRLANSSIYRRAIPEAFIWQAFSDFAGVYFAMATFRSPELGIHSGDDRFLIHLDVKDVNGMRNLL